MVSNKRGEPNSLGNVRSENPTSQEVGAMVVTLGFSLFMYNASLHTATRDSSQDIIVRVFNPRTVPELLSIPTKNITNIEQELKAKIIIKVRLMRLIRWIGEMQNKVQM